MADTEDTGFLSRWSRRKALVRDGAAPSAAPSTEPPPTPVHAKVAPSTPISKPPASKGPTASPAAQDDPQPTQPPPTLDDAQALTPDADFSRFVGREVDPGVRHTALKKLFADPHYNLMDGLDIYIDDYGKPDPLPAGMLRRMAQSVALNLFSDETVAKPGAAPAAPLPPTYPAAAPAPAAPPTIETLPDEDTDLRLQPDDAAGPSGPEPGAEPDPGRQS